MPRGFPYKEVQLQKFLPICENQLCAVAENINDTPVARTLTLCYGKDVLVKKIALFLFLLS